MAVGPILGREVLTVPRQWQHFALRGGYAAAFFVLAYTASQASFGWKRTTSIGEISRFGTLLFDLFSIVQLALVVFFAPLFAASRVAQEKDRQTLVLLLMTDLRNSELVWGKLLASLLPVAVVIATSVPVFGFVYLLGGVSAGQIVWSVTLTAATAFAAGSWGSLVAFWREKTFQTLTISALGLVLFVGGIETLLAVSGDGGLLAPLRFANPCRGLLIVLDPLAALPNLRAERIPVVPYVLTMLLGGALFNGLAVRGLRVWNPSRTLYTPVIESDTAPGASRSTRTRSVWNTPIIWREICTAGYGRKMFVLKLGYALLFAIGALFVARTLGQPQEKVLQMVSPAGGAFIALTFLGLLIVNAQTVTAITTERDAKTLELLLVTEISASEFIFGKVGGALYNVKEIIALPFVGLTAWTIWGDLAAENFFFLAVGLAVLTLFSAVLGLHAGLTFDSSRQAIANSLGTMFFLFLGAFVCLTLIVEAQSSFLLQLPSFLVFILGGSLGLWASLTHKNPSSALTLSAFMLPFFTFYAITGYLLGDTFSIWLVLTLAYSFTTAAMLVPAVSEFDAALGRTSTERG